jgi:hypothetical protein
MPGAETNDSPDVLAATVVMAGPRAPLWADPGAGHDGWNGAAAVRQSFRPLV